MDEIETCVAKLRGEEQPTTGVTDIRQNEVMPHVQKVLRDGRVLIIRDGITYDVYGHIVAQ